MNINKEKWFINVVLFVYSLSLLHVTTVFAGGGIGCFPGCKEVTVIAFGSDQVGFRAQTQSPASAVENLRHGAGNDDIIMFLNEFTVTDEWCYEGATDCEAPIHADYLGTYANLCDGSWEYTLAICVSIED